MHTTELVCISNPEIYIPRNYSHIIAKNIVIAVYRSCPPSFFCILAHQAYQHQPCQPPTSRLPIQQNPFTYQYIKHIDTGHSEIPPSPSPFQPILLNYIVAHPVRLRPCLHGVPGDRTPLTQARREELRPFGSPLRVMPGAQLGPRRQG